MNLQRNSFILGIGQYKLMYVKLHIGCFILKIIIYIYRGI